MDRREIPRFQSREFRALEPTPEVMTALMIHGADAEQFFNHYTLRDPETGRLMVHPERPITRSIAEQFAPHLQALEVAGSFALDIQGVHPLEDPERIRHDILVFAWILSTLAYPESE